MVRLHPVLEKYYDFAKTRFNSSHYNFSVVSFEIHITHEYIMLIRWPRDLLQIIFSMCGLSLLRVLCEVKLIAQLRLC